MRLSRTHITTTAPPHDGYFSRKLAHPLEGTAIMVPRFRVVLSTPGFRLSLYTRTMFSTSSMNVLDLYPCSQRPSGSLIPFRWTQNIPVTIHLSPSLSVGRLFSFRMRQTRVSRVALSRLRLAASDQDRICPYPHVPRASDCLCFFVHSLPGQPHRCGGIGACSVFFTSFLMLFTIAPHSFLAHF